jgi:hypothetical protein
MADERTQDPLVVIEERREGYVRYRNTETGRRWEVHGECVGLGHCIVGAVLPDGEHVETLERAKEVWAERRERFLLDSPITPEFKGCCPFRFVEL